MGMNSLIPPIVSGARTENQAILLGVWELTSTETLGKVKRDPSYLSLNSKIDRHLFGCFVQQLMCGLWFLLCFFFRYRWGGKGASNNPCSEIYRGSKAFSEPETKAMSVSMMF